MDFLARRFEPSDLGLSYITRPGTRDLDHTGLDSREEKHQAEAWFRSLLWDSLPPTMDLFAEREYKEAAAHMGNPYAYTHHRERFAVMCIVRREIFDLCGESGYILACRNPCFINDEISVYGLYVPSWHDAISVQEFESSRNILTYGQDAWAPILCSGRHGYLDIIGTMGIDSYFAPLSDMWKGIWTINLTDRMKVGAVDNMRPLTPGLLQLQSPYYHDELVKLILDAEKSKFVMMDTEGDAFVDLPSDESIWFGRWPSSRDKNYVGAELPAEVARRDRQRTSDFTRTLSRAMYASMGLEQVRRGPRLGGIRQLFNLRAERQTRDTTSVEAIRSSLRRLIAGIEQTNRDVANCVRITTSWPQSTRSPNNPAQDFSSDPRRHA